MRYLTAGESHGPQLTAIIEGVPAGLELTAEHINEDLARRQRTWARTAACRLKKIKFRLKAGFATVRRLVHPLL